MRRTTLPHLAFLALLVLLCLLPLACAAPPPEQQEADQATAATTPTPLPQPTAEQLAELDPLVREQIEERQAWHRRIVADPALPTEQQAKAYGELGVLYQGYTLVEPALAAFREARRLNPRDARWPYYLGQILWRQNQPAEAIEMFEAALELKPRDAPTLVRLGEVLLEQSRLEEADRRFAAAVEAQADDNDAVALFNRGQIAAQQGDAQKAVEFFEQALAADPEATSIYNPLAVAYRRLGQEDRARRMLEKRGEGTVRLTDPLMERPFFVASAMRRAFEAGEAQYRQGQPGEALQSYRRAVAADPLFTRPRMRLATTLVEMAQAAEQVEGQEQTVTGALTEARRQYEIVLRIDPDEPRAHTQLAYLLTRQGNPAAAERHYRSALEADPDDTLTWLSLGNLLLDLGRPGDAHEAFTTLLSMDPASLPAQVGEARALIRLGRGAEARDRLRAALEQDPGAIVPAHLLARLLATAEDAAVRDGRQALPLAVAVYRDQPTLLHGETLAMALAAAGNHREAIDLQEKLLAQVREAGDEAYAVVLEGNLQRYRAGEGAAP